jgi:hypothetical protein
MTAPAQNGSRPSTAAPLPSPKVQAVTFALELAKVRASTGVAADKHTSVEQLIDDATAIASFIGTGR